MWLLYLRSGDAKNFPWRLIPTADLLLLPNLQRGENMSTFNDVYKYIYMDRNIPTLF